MSTHDIGKFASIYNKAGFRRTLSGSELRHPEHELIARGLRSHFEREQEPQLPQQFQDLLQKLDALDFHADTGKNRKWR